MSVPAEPESLALVRLFIGAVARRHDFGDEATTADLKLLATEAITIALPGAGSVRIAIAVGPGSIELTVSPVSDFQPGESVPDPYDVVMALSKKAELTEGELRLAYEISQ